MDDSSLAVDTTNDVVEIIELNKTEQEIQNFDAEIESCAQDAEVIQNVQEVVAKAADGDGLSPASAEIAEIVLESLYGRLGIQKKSIMSLEAYNDPKQRRKEITRIACENIQETLVRVLKAVKEAIAKLWQNIKMFIAKIFSSIAMVRKEIKRMEDKFNEMKDVEIKSTIVEDMSLCKAFSIDGKANAKTVDDLMKNHLKLATQCRAITHGCDNFLNRLTELSVKWTGKSFDAEGKLRLIQSFDRNVDFLRKELFPMEATINGKKGYFIAPELIQSRYFGVEAQQQKDVVYGIDLSSLTPALTPVVGVNENNKIADKIETADKDNIKTILNNLSSLCDALDKMQSWQTDITKFEKNTEAVFAKALARLKNESPDVINQTEEADVINIVKYGATRISRTYGIFVTQLPKLTIEGIRYSLNYVRLSLQQTA
jgi:hypothetical protein